MCFIVGVTGRHFERPRWQHDWCVGQTLLLLDGCIVSRVWPPLSTCPVTERVFVLSLIHVFAHTHRWSPMMHPFSHATSKQTQTVVTCAPSHLLYFLLPCVRACMHVCVCVFFSPSALPEGASPVKLHHWHSHHSTYFSSFQVTSSLLSNKWLNWRSPQLRAGWMPSHCTCHMDGWLEYFSG